MLDLIPRYDSADTLFYIDPPYWNCETDYGEGVLARNDFARLADLLAQIRGCFILSINGTAGAREVFGRFAIDEVKTKHARASRSAITRR